MLQIACLTINCITFFTSTPFSQAFYCNLFIYLFLLLLLDSIVLRNRLQFWLAGCGQKSHLADYLFLCRLPHFSAEACEIKCLVFTNIPNHTLRQRQHTTECIYFHTTTYTVGLKPALSGDILCTHWFTLGHLSLLTDIFLRLQIFKLYCYISYKINQCNKCT